MAIAIVIVLLVIGSIIFHFISPWWFTPLASNWQAIDDTINITLWVTGVVFVLVSFFLAFVVFRFKYDKNKRADYQPENKKLELWLTGVTAVGVIAMLTPGLFVWGQFISVPEDSDTIEVVGQQWHWNFRLPGVDGKLGRTSMGLITQDNPFGIDVNDPFSLDDIVINKNELHLPLDRPVKILLRSKDVLHNFTVPQFRVKMDLVPGTTTYFWLTPNKIGRFEILCLELCGMGHYTMRGHIDVESAQSYDKWLAKQQTFTQSLQQSKGDIVKGQQLYNSCILCHGVDAQGKQQTGAPRLAGLSRWYIKRQLSYFKEKVRGDNKQDSYGMQMSAMTMVLDDDTAIKDVAAYIDSLSAENSAGRTAQDQLVTASTINISNGERLYKQCSYCHGKQAQGEFFMNAPKLNNQHAWYLKRQLKYFQQGIRGQHPQDLYGNQMILMSKLLHSDEDINDVVAYVGTLTTTLAP